MAQVGHPAVWFAAVFVAGGVAGAGGLYWSIAERSTAPTSSAVPSDDSEAQLDSSDSQRTQADAADKEAFDKEALRALLQELLEEQRTSDDEGEEGVSAADALARLEQAYREQLHQEQLREAEAREREVARQVEAQLEAELERRAATERQLAEQEASDDAEDIPEVALAALEPSSRAEPSSEREVRIEQVNVHNGDVHQGDVNHVNVRQMAMMTQVAPVWVQAPVAPQPSTAQTPPSGRPTTSPLSKPLDSAHDRSPWSPIDYSRHHNPWGSTFGRLP